jgi:signal transduction histidine kinase
MKLTSWSILTRAGGTTDPSGSAGDRASKLFRAWFGENPYRRWIHGAIAAVTTVALAALATSQWPNAFIDEKVLPFLIAVVVTSIIGGGVPSALAVGLSLLWLQVLASDAGTRPLGTGVVRLLSLVGVAALTVVLNSRRTRALAQVDHVKSDLEQRVERRTAELAGAVSRLRQEAAHRQRARDELRSVTSYARCILWRAELEGGKDWETDSPGSSIRIPAWKVWVQDEQAAQSVLPLDLNEAGSYYRAWVKSRHPDDVLTAGRVFRQAVLGGSASYSHEYRCYDRDGRERWLSEEVQIQKVSPGRWRLFGVTTDATERKRAEREVLEHRQRLRALAAEVSKTEERERRQIAAALHDQIGSLLAVAQMQLDGMRLNADPATLDRSHRAVLDDVVTSLEQAIGHTRSLTCELSPPLLYEAGLEAAVNWLGDQIHRRHGLDVVVTATGDADALDQEFKVLLFQGVRELLTNTVKHARATVARVEIDVTPAEARVTVKDDGVGLGQSTVSRPNGFGLFHLRERLEHLGGQLVTTSAPNQGTQSVMTVARQATSGPPRA